MKTIYVVHFDGPLSYIEKLEVDDSENSDNYHETLPLAKKALVERLTQEKKALAVAIKQIKALTKEKL